MTPATRDKLDAALMREARLRRRGLAVIALFTVLLLSAKVALVGLPGSFRELLIYTATVAAFWGVVGFVTWTIVAWSIWGRRPAAKDWFGMGVISLSTTPGAGDALSPHAHSCGASGSSDGGDYACSGGGDC